MTFQHMEIFQDGQLKAILHVPVAINTQSISLRNKLCYMGHRCFLPMNHPWRKNRMLFDGKVEMGIAPRPLTGDEVLMQLHELGNVSFGKVQKRKRNVSNNAYNLKKKSIFFQLPYWKSLKLRHNLDVMHIERNVSDNILSTVMSMVGKTKDTLKSRYDLVDLAIRQGLHPIEDEDNILLPAACYALSPQEKLKLCNFIANFKVPDILPVAIRGLLPKKVCEPIIALGNFFKNRYAKCLKIEDLDILEAEIPIILYKLQMVFPPAFFDIMIHLPIHLVREAKLGGPVQYRDMYPIERYLRTLKGDVRNLGRPEGSIAEGASIFNIYGDGFRFQTKELVRKTQNSGVLVRGDDADSNKKYYGVLEDIYELRYVGNRKVYLFKCHWWDVAHLGRGHKIDSYGFTSVNTHCALNTNEPFVLASQSEQFFNLNDTIDKDWLVVVKTNPHDVFSMPEVEEELINEEVYLQEEVECNILSINDQEIDIVVSLHRDDIEPQTVLRTNDEENQDDDFINDNNIDVFENEESEEELIDDNDGDDSDTSF
ncbi:uncharacterized protein LOC129872461 [Solanum dulcamara]|uniref:uncharacterized protein LOC129872461 n=1 Tax=Solanum dulcamara TaxID=45834 RepID=UPI002486399B|nr:uncharacterized protein LOC129872461 [Solanum dulcamara]